MPREVWAGYLKSPGAQDPDLPLATLLKNHTSVCSVRYGTAVDQTTLSAYLPSGPAERLGTFECTAIAFVLSRKP